MNKLKIEIKNRTLYTRFDIYNNHHNSILNWKLNHGENGVVVFENWNDDAWHVSYTNYPKFLRELNRLKHIIAKEREHLIEKYG